MSLDIEIQLALYTNNFILKIQKKRNCTRKNNSICFPIEQHFYIFLKETFIQLSYLRDRLTITWVWIENNFKNCR